MATRKKLDLKAFGNELAAKRTEIVELGESAEALQTSIELDQTRIGRLSRMDALQVHAMEEETERRREAEIHRIDAALKRMEEGEYGYCIRCGDAIPLKRLEFDPSTPLCVDCAKV